MDDLQTLELPRHVHQADGVSRIVRTFDELEDAIDDGWMLRPPTDVDPHGSTDHEAAAPTFEVYVAAGYSPDSYPPQGYPEVPSPGLTAFRAEQAEAARLVAAQAAQADPEPASTNEPPPDVERLADAPPQPTKARRR